MNFNYKKTNEMENGKLSVNFELINTINSNNIKSFGTIFFNSKYDLSNYMLGYVSAYKEFRKNIELYAFNSETHELIKTV